MKSNLFKIMGRVGIYALVAFSVFWGMRNATAERRDGAVAVQNAVGSALPQGAFSPSPSPTPTPTPTATPQQEINGTGTFAGPNGGQAHFFIFDVENEQITQKYLEGAFGYSDRGSHITFGTGKINTVTINGNQAAFTGTATIGKSKQQVDFTVSVTGNQMSPTADTFSISMSNGYSASGTLTKGSIRIDNGED
jgi:hypothetical protein